MRRDSLWFHRDFRRLWAGDTASQFGTHVGHAVLPLLAATALAASPMEMGLLAAAEYAAFLFLGLPAGVWVDRMRRRPLMLGADVVRGILLLTIPLAWWLDVLTMTQVVVVALVMGGCTLFFDVAYQSYLPSLVGRAKLVEGNAKLQVSMSAAQVTGPGIGGPLVQLLGAANAVTAIGVSYLTSAACLLRIRAPEPEPQRREGARMRTEVVEGLRFVLGNPTLRAITACTAAGNLAGAALNALQVLFLTRDVGLSPAAVGSVLAAAGAGGVLGALTASWWTRRIGQARTVWVAPLATFPPMLLLPLAEPGWRVAFGVAALTILGYGVVVYNVAQVSYRQAICPDRLLGRMNASVRFLVWGTMPIGGLAGGALGQWLGLRPAIWVAAAATALSVLFVVLSPLRSMRDIPTEVVAER